MYLVRKKGVFNQKGVKLFLDHHPPHPGMYIGTFPNTPHTPPNSLFPFSLSAYFPLSQQALACYLDWGALLLQSPSHEFTM